MIPVVAYSNFTVWSIQYDGMGEDKSPELIQLLCIRQTTLDDYIYLSFLSFSFLFFSQKCLLLEKIFFLLKNTIEKKIKIFITVYKNGKHEFSSF